MFQFRVPVRTFRDLCEQQVETISTQDGPGPVTTGGSLKALCPKLWRGGETVQRGVAIAEARAVACRVVW